MKIIAHRGLLEGPNRELENKPEQIQKALDAGFYVEVDLRYIHGKGWFFGHDAPQYQLSDEWFDKITDDFSKSRIYIHAKDLLTLGALSDMNKNRGEGKINFFFHDRDDATLTTYGEIWTFPGKILLGEPSIAVLPEKIDADLRMSSCGGICTDYPIYYKNFT